jgi:E3 ubiquitin-protein ligase RNF14
LQESLPRPQLLSIDEVLMSVYINDQAVRDAEFAAAQHTCHICLESATGKAGSTLECRHWFCQACLQQLATVAIQSGSLQDLRCPEPTCKRMFAPHVVHHLVADKALFNRWEELTLDRGLEQMPDIGHCPHCNSHCVLENQDFAQCPKCFLAFCTLCHSSWHPGSECMSAEQRLVVLQKRAELGGARGQQLALVRPLSECPDITSQALILSTVAQQCVALPIMVPKNSTLYFKGGG